MTSSSLKMVGKREKRHKLTEMNPMQGVMVVQVVRDTQKVYMNGMITYQESACNTMLCKASELMKTITKEIKQVPIDFINKNFIN